MTDSLLAGQDPNVAAVLRKVSKGEVVLFLGSGVNKGSLNSVGEDAPIGNELANKIKQHFLPNDDLPENDLKLICDCVETRTSRSELDRFIYDLLIDYSPSNDVLSYIPYGKWRSIYTTNFDILIEEAYRKEDGRLQNLVPIYSDQDSQNFIFGQDLPYFKLHGCITKISTHLRLTLTAQDYAAHRDNRQRLFNRLQDDLNDNTILFIGYSLSDPNFTDLFYSIQQGMQIRDFPRCYAIVPNAPSAIVDAWRTRKVELLNLTGAQFFNLTNELPVEKYTPPEKLQEQITILNTQLARKIDFDIANELFRCFERVDNRVGYEPVRHKSFFQGNRPSWSEIRNNCDANRTLYETIFEDVILVEEINKRKSFEIAVITAEAGSGKTTLLMRLAYDNACSFEKFCLFHNSFCDIPIDAIEELCRLERKRVFLFVDNAADNISALTKLAKRATALNLQITVICAERKNEWNAVKGRLLPTISIDYDLPYLDDKEINNILDVLETHNYLCELQDKTLEERQLVFREKADKQLLVAMSEATEGRDFDAILEDEYNKIPSDKARLVYLHVCALHRFGIPVRSGLLKRLSGVSFSDFQELILGPCELVIHTDEDSYGDILYRARHPHIADVVCKYALRDKNDMTTLYLVILSKMDLGYTSDKYAFRQLIKASSPSIVENIPNIEQKRYFYEKALMLSNHSAEVYQQRGLMELRLNNFDEAEINLSTACSIEPDNNAYKHSYANLLFKKAQNSSSIPQSEKYIRDSQKLLSELLRKESTDPYAYHTYAEIYIYLSGKVDSPQKQDYLKDAHELVTNGLRRCPDKTQLYRTEATIFQKLGEDAKAKQSLYASHQTDATNIKTTLLLGRWLYRSEDYEAAYKVTSETLVYNSEHENLNKLAAQILQVMSPKDHNKIISLLKKAFDREFNDAEANYELAVEYFKAERFDEANEIFREFRLRKQFKSINGSYNIRNILKDEANQTKQFVGQIATINDNNAHINADLIPHSVFLPQGRRRGFKQGMRVNFNIGFNLFGPIAKNVSIAAEIGKR